VNAGRTLTVLDNRLAHLNDSQQDEFVRVLHPRQGDTKTPVVDGRRRSERIDLPRQVDEAKEGTVLLLDVSPGVPDNDHPKWLYSEGQIAELTSSKVNPNINLIVEQGNQGCRCEQYFVLGSEPISQVGAVARIPLFKVLMRAPLDRAMYGV
jgi:hypothetical protein